MGQYLAIRIVTSFSIAKKQFVSLSLKRLSATQLIGLLEAIYPRIYTDKSYYTTVLDKLRNSEPSDWIIMAGYKCAEAFQEDSYAMEEHFRKGKVKFSLNTKCILLSMEGKIFMEEYGDQFRFMKYTMVQTFKKYSLASALRIYITG